MTPIDLDSYFKARQAGSAALGNKLDQIVAAHDEKMARLAAASEARRKELEERGPSIVERLGIEATPVGQVVNLGASVVAGASRVAGDIVSLPVDMAGAVAGSAITEAQTAAYNRVATGKAQPGDAELLKSNAPGTNRPVIESLQQAEKLRKMGASVDKAFDLSGLVDNTKREQFSADLGAGFDAPWEQVKKGWAGLKGNEKLAGSADLVAGVAKLLFNAGDAAINNPAAVAEYVAENIPQLAIGLAGVPGKVALTASNVGYGVENYRKGIEEFQKQNAGQLPGEDQRRYMAMMAASTALAEVVGDQISLGSITKGADISREGFKQAMLGTVKATANGAVSEALTEGYQTYAEGEAGYKPATAKQIYEGAVVGGLTGGAMTGGGFALAEAATQGVAALEKAVAEAEQTQAKKAAEAQAASTGNVAALVDKTADTYAPEAAAEALQKFAARPDATEEEFKAAQLQTRTLIKSLAAEADELYMQTPSGKKEAAQGLAAAETALAAADPADAAAVQKLTAVRDEAKRLAELPEVPVEQLPAHQAKMMALEKQIDSISDVMTSMNQAAAGGQANLDELIGKLKEAEKTAAPAAQVQAEAEKVINLSMSMAGSLTPAQLSQVQQLANNKNLSTAQRSQLRLLSEAHIQANRLMNLDKVSQEVYYGNKDKSQVGIAMYVSRLTAALNQGDTALADRQLKGITKFESSHVGKAAAVTDAMQKAKAMKGGTNPGYKVLRTVDGQWSAELIPNSITADELKVLDGEIEANGGLRIHKGSAQVVSRVAQEAAALTKSRELMEAIYARKTAAPAAIAPAPAAPAVVSPAPAAAAQVAPVPAAPAPVAGPVAAPAPQPSAATVTGAAQAPVQAVAAENKPTQTKQAPAPVKEESFTEANTKAYRELSDGLGLTDKIENLFAQGMTVAQVVGKLNNERGFSKLEKGEKTSLVIATRASLGIPSRGTAEGVVEFNEWLAKRKVKTKAQAPAPVSAPAPAPVPAPAPAEDAAPKEAEPAPEEKKAEAKPTTQFKGLEGRVKQGGTNEIHGTLKPLASVPHFISTWVASKSMNLLKGMLPKKMKEWEEEKRENALRAIKHVGSTIESWMPIVASGMPMTAAWDKVGDAYREQDMLHALSAGTDENGQAVLPENVLAAISYGAYSWLMDKAMAPAFLTPEELLEMHGQPDDTELSHKAWETLAMVTSFEDVAIHDLGRLAVQALGIKADENTPLNLIPRLQNALGTHALLLLEQQGAVVRKGIQRDVVMAEVFNQPTATPMPAAVLNYVGIARNQDLSPAGIAGEIREANYGASGVVDMLFGSDREPNIAQTTASKFTDQVARRTDQKLTPEIKQALQQTMDTPHTVIPEMLHLMLHLGRENILKAAGWREANTKTLHKVNLAAVTAQNQNLESQFDLMMEMMGLRDLDNVTPESIEKAKGTSWFVNLFVGSNFRVFSSTHSLNQQTSKIHRFMFQRPAWRSTINLADTELVNTFLISMGQNLGVKVENQTNPKTLAKIQKDILAEGTDFVKAADAIRRNEWTDADKELVTEVAAKEGMVALQALQALALYRQALADKKDSFEVTLLVGADGKTNGPILTHLALGAAATPELLKQTLNRGGMFFKDDNWEHYSQFAEAKNHDLYQDLSAAVLKIVNSRVIPLGALIKLRKKDFKESLNWITKEELDAFQAITGELQDSAGGITSKGRNLVKTPLTAFAFGSSLSKAVKSMQAAFLQQFYDQVEAAAVGEDKEALIKTLTAMNTLLKRGKWNGEQFNVNMSFEKALETELSKEQLTALGYAFRTVMGNSVDAAMKSKFATFIENRSALNSTIAASFNLYHTAYLAARERKIEQLMEDGKLPFTEGRRKIGWEKGKTLYESTGVRTPTRDLTAAEEKSVRDSISDLLPVMHSSYSRQAKDLRSGLYMAKQDERLSDAPQYQNKVLLGQPVTVPDTQTLRDLDKQVDEVPVTELMNLTSKSFVRMEVEPGAKGTPVAIHSTDSAIMQRSLLAFSEAMGLNVHDEVSTGVHNIAQSAHAINQTTYEAFLNYSPAAEAREMLRRQMQALQDRIVDGTLPGGIVSVVGQAWADNLNSRLPPDTDPFSPEDALRRVPSMIDVMAFEADTMRLRMLIDMTVVDQYTWEGGQFVVTEELRKQAEGQLAGLSKKNDGFYGLVDFMVEAAKEDAVDLADSFDEYEAATNQLPGEQEPIDKSPHIKRMQSVGLPGVMAPVVALAAPGVPDSVAVDLLEGTPVTEALAKQEPAERAKSVEAMVTAAANVLPGTLSPWGLVGAPLVESNTTLVNFLASKGTTTVAELAPVLMQVLKDQGSTTFNQFNQLLLNQLVKLKGDLSIKYVTLATPASDVIDAPKVDASRGWFVATSKGREQAYILSPEFVHSGVQPEVLLHEILHGVLYQAIEKPVTEQAKKLVSELEWLRAGLSNLVAKGALSPRFTNAVSSVHELVSWGMSNEGFQQALNRVTLNGAQLNRNQEAPKRLDGRTVFGKFLKSVLGYLMPGKTTDDRYETALGLLLHNTASLFAETANKGKQLDLFDMNASMASPVDKTWRYTTQELFEALGSQPGVAALPGAFAAHLKGLLETMVAKLHGLGGYTQANRPGLAAMTALDVWAKAQSSGETPFTSEITPFVAVTQQEAFVIEHIEATVKAAMDNPGATIGFSYGELRKLYMEARKTLKRSDFSNPVLYDLAFAVKSDADKKSNYLARFAAIGLGSQEFNTLLRRRAEPDTLQLAGLSLDEKLKAFFAKVMDWLAGLATRNIDGEPVNFRLQKLVGQLVDIEARKRMSLASAGPLSKFKVDTDKLTAAAGVARESLASVANSTLIKNSKIGVVRMAGVATSILAKGQVLPVIRHGLLLRDQVMADRQGFVAGMLNSLHGPAMVFRELIRLAKKNEKIRKQLIDDTARQVMDEFQNGNEMPQASKAALTQVFLRTGLHTLLKTKDQSRGLSIDEIQRLLESPKALAQAIEDRVNSLANYSQRHYYVKQAKALGYFKATGLQGSPMGMMNAGNIARLFGTRHAGQVSEAQAANAEVVLAELASLYAVSYQEAEVLTAAKEVLRDEINRTDGRNGVEQVLRLHKELENQAKARLFQGSDALMAHGHTAEIFNPHVAVQTARTPAEAAYLEEQGYTKVMDLGKDDLDPDRANTALYVLKDGGLMPYSTGAISLTDREAKGNARYVELRKGNLTQQVTSRRQKEVDAMFAADPNWDPVKASGRYMTPVVNPEGKVVEWRYLMSDANKNQILERDSRIEHVLGALAGSIFDKEETPKQNATVVEALHDLYRADFHNRPKSYVEISMTTPNAEMREIFRMLPADTQAEIQRVWGTKGMHVPYEALDAVFGYRKLSVASAFDKAANNRLAERQGVQVKKEDELGKLEELFVTLTEMVLYGYAKGIKNLSDKDAEAWARASGVKVRQLERGWQEVMREVKDTIVVRNLTTLMGNLKSNASLLLVYGISPSDIIRDTRVAWKGAVDYKRDRSELSRLRMRLDSGYTLGDEKAMRDRVAMLEDSIARNPVLALIEGGLMPTIVEDLAQDEDLYSYKTLFTRKSEEMINKVHPDIRSAWSWLYMTHDNVLYKSLSQVTQLSDFTGRYVLYQHLVNREKAPMSKDVALEEASEAFVNYDIPMHRGMQYLDDMGITMFTKYYLNIQRVLLKLGKERPVQMLLLAALHQMFGRMDSVIESAMPYRLGNNPLHLGPLEAGSVLQELSVVQITDGLLGGGSNGWQQ